MPVQKHGYKTNEPQWSQGVWFLQAEMQSFVSVVVSLMKQHELFAQQGGPIILAQVTNKSNTSFAWKFKFEGIRLVRQESLTEGGREEIQQFRWMPQVHRARYLSLGGNFGLPCTDWEWVWKHWCCLWRGWKEVYEVGCQHGRESQHWCPLDHVPTIWCPFLHCTSYPCISVFHFQKHDMN